MHALKWIVSLRTFYPHSSPLLRTCLFGVTGIKQLRFKPAYNPYTEPSMEIFGYHPELGKWTEIGAYLNGPISSVLLPASTLLSIGLIQ
jgi:hypothetical protein